MLTELYNKGGRVCQEARKGNIKCRLIVRPTSEDVITGHLTQAFRILNPRWFLPDILNQGLKASRFRRQVFRNLQVEPWRNRPRYPRDLLPWDEGSTQIDLSIQWENAPSTVYFEAKYLAELSPNTSNGPSNQLIRLIRVGLLECGWFQRDDQVTTQPRDFVCILFTPNKNNELVRYYQNPENVTAAIPNNDKLLGLPKTPFVGELTYSDLIRVLKRQRTRFTRPEKTVIDHVVEYLQFKLERTGMNYEVPRCEPKLVSITKPEEVNHG